MVVCTISYESEASLVYTETSRPARFIWWGKRGMHAGVEHLDIFLFNQFCLLSEMGYYCVTQSCSDWTQTQRSNGPPASGFINSWDYEHMQSYALKKKLRPHLLMFRYGMRPWHRPTWLVFWLPVHRPSQLQKSPDLFCLSQNRLI